MDANFSLRRINIAIISISLLMMAVVINLPFRARPLGDLTFHMETKNLALFLKGALPYKEVIISRAPGPVLFYLPAYLVAPVDACDNELWIFATVLSLIAATISLLLVFRTACLFFSKEVGVLAMLLFFIFPIHFYYSLGILAEIPAFFSLALAIYGWAIAFREPSRKSGWVLMAIGISFLILTRPNTILLLVLGFALVAYSFVRNKAFFLAYGKQLLVALCCTAIIGFSILQCAKAITVKKTTLDQERFFYYVAHEGRFQFREEPLDFRFWKRDLRADSKDYQNWVKSESDLRTIIKTTHQSDKVIYKNFLIDDLKQHPFWFARQFFVKCLYGNIHIINSVRPNLFAFGPFKGNAGYVLFNVLLNLINFVIIIGAVIFLMKEKHLIRYWIFWGSILTLLIFHGLFYMEPRYIFPSKIGLYLLGAAGLYRIGGIKNKVDWMSGFLFPAEKSSPDI